MWTEWHNAGNFITSPDWQVLDSPSWVFQPQPGLAARAFLFREARMGLRTHTPTHTLSRLLFTVFPAIFTAFLTFQSTALPIPKPLNGSLFPLN